MPPSTENGEVEDDQITASTPNAEPDAPSTEGENEAQPSGGQDEGTADEPKSMAEAIAQALATDTDKADEPKPEDDPDGAKSTDKDKTDAKADPDAAKTPDTDTSKQPAEGSADKDDDPSDEELKGYQPKVQKRIKQLLAQRNDSRRAAETFAEDAGHYRNIRQFMSESQLADGEVAELFQIGRLLKANDIAGYEKALDMILPIAQQLLEATGRSLPKDLRDKVESGELTEEVARDTAVQRSRATVAERRVQQVTKQQQTQQQQVASQAHVTAVQTAVGQWTDRTRQSDPDFGLKADAMRDAALALVSEKGRPKNPEEAVKMAELAYARVNSWFKSAQPKRQASRPAPTSGQTGNRSGLTPEPKSLKEAIFGAMKAGQ